VARGRRTVEDVHVRGGREFGSSASPRSPRSQKSSTSKRRSAKTVGAVSVTLRKTLIKPLFSATKMRLSLANDSGAPTTRMARWLLTGRLGMNAVGCWSRGREPRGAKSGREMDGIERLQLGATLWCNT